VKVCDKTCIFFFFPITNKYFLMAKRSLLSRCPSYIFSVSSVFGKYGSQVPKFGTASNDVTVVHL